MSCRLPDTYHAESPPILKHTRAIRVQAKLGQCSPAEPWHLYMAMLAYINTGVVYPVAFVLATADSDGGK